MPGLKNKETRPLIVFHLFVFCPEIEPAPGVLLDFPLST